MSDDLPPLTITAEQRREALEWQRRLMRGDCTIDEALGMVMTLGVPVPPLIQQAYLQAWMRYQEGEGDLAGLLGHPLSDRDRQQVRDLERASIVWREVNAAAVDGFPKSDAAPVENAYEAAASRLARMGITNADGDPLSPDRVRAIYKAYNRGLGKPPLK